MERDFSVIHVSSTSYVRVLPPKFQKALVRHSQTLDVFDDPPKKAILMGKWDQNPGDVHKLDPVARDGTGDGEIILVAIKMADLNDAHFFENQHLHLQKDFPTQEGTPLTC